MRIAVISKSKIEYEFDGCSIDFVKSGSEVTTEEWLEFDAVFLLAPFDDDDVANWTGHPHLRVCNNKDELIVETKALFSNIEIEKSF